MLRSAEPGREKDPGADTTIGLPDDPPPRPAIRRHLLVLQGDTAVPFTLPARGTVVVGRGTDATLHITDPAASRRHALLQLTPEAAHVLDAGSHNGTLVNGQRLAAPRTLVSGDVIGIGEVCLIYHCDASAPRPATLSDSDQILTRLSQEIVRAVERRHRVVVIARLEVHDENVDRGTITASLSSALRPLDAVAWDHDGAGLLLLLPDLHEHEVEEHLLGLLQTLGTRFPMARLGYSACPTDGNDADTLLGGAREAARLAAAGRALGVCLTTQTLRFGPHTVLVADPAMHRVYDLLRRLASSELPVLITGETGAGKEIAAAALHHGSSRRDRPFLMINCAALPEHLVESELFGHKKGAFTGADANKIGLLHAVSGGTLFLDELGELPLPVQAKLLRALEDRRARPVGDHVERPFDLRLVAATNRDLVAEIEAQRFRQDLYFRLGAACVALPPLRDRRRELPVLARHFLDESRRAAGQPPMSISAAAMGLLLSHRWPGNVRELRNAMARVAVLWTEEPMLLAHHLDGQLGAAAPPSTPGRRPLYQELEDLERTRIEEALTETGGALGRAADILGMPVRTLHNKIKRYRIQRRGIG